MPREQRLHLEQFDERLGARRNSRLLEQRLLFDRLEIEILRERIHQVLVAHRFRRAGVDSAAAFGRRHQRLEPCALLAQQHTILAGKRGFRHRLGSRAPVSQGLVLAEDAEAFEPAQDDVVAAVGKPLDSA